MPDRTITFLGYALAGLLSVYVVLVIATVSFATMQTELALSVRDTESRIGVLETHYYAQVGMISATDPHTLNLSKPAKVSYAALAPAPSLSVRY